MSAASALEWAIICLALLTLLAIVERQVRFWRSHEKKSKTKPKNADFPSADLLALITIEVSSRLGAGESAETAWQTAWARRGFDSGKVDSAGIPKALINPDIHGKDKEMRLAAASALASACRFSFLLGAPLAEVLERTATSIEGTLRAFEAQQRAFAAPVLSSRVLASLPILAIFFGEAMGAGSLEWLFSTSLGRICFLIGGLALTAGLVVSASMVARARAHANDRVISTTLCDLAAAGLQSGASVTEVLRALAVASERPSLRITADELVLGVPWSHAWEGANEHELLRDSLEPGWQGGVSPVALLTTAAKHARERSTAGVEEDAAKLSVKLVVPLGALLLPAFVLLGLAPIIASLMQGLGL